MVGKWIKESKIVNENFNGRYINLLASKTVQDSGNVSLRKIFGFVKIWVRIFFELLLKKRPDMCYLALTTTGAAFYRDTMVIFLLKLFRVKRVYHLHNKGVLQKARSKVHSIFYRYVFNGAEVILLSKYLYRDVKVFVPKAKAHVCPNGIPGIAPHLEQKSTDHVPQILFLSNLIESKGVGVLLKALQILKDRGHAFECLFVGGEGDISRERLLGMAEEMNMRQHIKYLGKKHGEEKKRILESADIFSLPTYYQKECFPLVLLEAMQNELPIVATREGGIPSIVENDLNGFLVPQQDAVQLAEKLKLLITNPQLRRKMGAAGRERFEKSYTLEHFENRIVAIFKLIVAPKYEEQTEPRWSYAQRSLLNIRITGQSYRQSIENLSALARMGTSSYACMANAHMCVEAHQSPEFARIVNGADVITPDGMPLAKGIRLLYGVRQERIAGMDLLPDLLKTAEKSGIKVFFYGSRLATLQRTEQYCSTNYPRLEIAGLISPPFRLLTSEEEQEHINIINDSGAGFVFVALGCPKQEKWMASMKGRVNACMVGIGGALPVMVGLQRRAPVWMQQASLEWLYRLMQEPVRLFRRYAITNTMFVYLLLKQWASQGFRPAKEEAWQLREAS